jgi:hypothetical protein
MKIEIESLISKKITCWAARLWSGVAAGAWMVETARCKLSNNPSSSRRAPCMLPLLPALSLYTQTNTRRYAHATQKAQSVSSFFRTRQKIWLSRTFSKKSQIPPNIEI